LRQSGIQRFGSVAVALDNEYALALHGPALA